MVVIREKKQELIRNIGNNYFSRLRDFAGIIGYSIEEDDDEFKIEFNPDRPDLFSFYALKSAMRTFYEGDYPIEPIFHRMKSLLGVDASLKNERPFALSFTATGKPLGKYYSHIIDYQERLHETAGKSRRKMAIGIHDLDSVKPPFKLTMVNRKRISFTTYDNFHGTAEEILQNHDKGKQYGNLILSRDSVPVILDREGDVLSMPPIINGIKSRISENTSRLFFDITGTDYNAVFHALYLFAYEMSYIGYNVSIPEIAGRAGRYDWREISLTHGEIKKIMGIEPECTVMLLRKMGYRCEVSSNGYLARVPGNRIDVMGPVDLIEDIAKAYGYARIEERVLVTSGTGHPYIYNDYSSKIRDIMTSLNYQEVKTFVLNSGEFYRHTGYSGDVSIENPKSLDYSVIRDKLFPGIMALLSINRRRKLPVKIFEIGDVVVSGTQENHLSVLFNNSRASYSDIYQIMEYLISRTSGSDYRVEPAVFPEILPGRGGRIIIGGDSAGIIGEMNPAIFEDFGIPNPVAFLEINLDILFSHIK
ncbi:MAG: phenylalanine--tRNA ligase subunit beta [Ferroplasma sp.]|uniref:phenylalanine--tRNA ligase subunit beta n=1 Tax=Ferroplasma sp. TaxID=2591003 RepID=UPI002815F2CD|nr:phenylalanine--tRNA ligase subunit beta [Ferroplasma sp.]WMT51301.1 MAG: phenylalanine--tRNA ligase subunit beta [Ferroplasma sp.]